MNTLALIPLAAAVIVAGGIIYLYFPRDIVDMDKVMNMLAPLSDAVKRMRPKAAAASVAKTAPADSEDLLAREVGRVRKLAAELNKGRLDMEWSERELMEKSKKLDLLIAKAEQTLKKAASAEASSKNDNYSKAGLLLEMGLPAEEIKSRLGLLSGEVELMETLKSYRSATPGDGIRRKKAPYTEVPSRPGKAAPMRQAGQVV